MSAKICVVGADGWLGTLAARHLSATRVVFGRAEGIPFEDWRKGPREENIIINASGWRVRPGLTRADYFRSHGGTTRQLVEALEPRHTLIHFSSASVMGANRRVTDGAEPSPRTFPAPDYAEAKLEAERIALDAAKTRGFQVVVLRPAIVYSPGGEGMVATLLKLAQKGLLLKILPGRAIHHLCSDQLLLAVLDQLAVEPGRFTGRVLSVADPFTPSNDQIAREVGALFPTRKLVAPLPAKLLSAVLRCLPRTPKFDGKTWGEILGVWALNSEYDSSWIWQELMLNPEHYAQDKRWRETLLAGSGTKA